MLALVYVCVRVCAYVCVTYVCLRMCMCVSHTCNVCSGMLYLLLTHKLAAAAVVYVLHAVPSCVGMFVFASLCVCGHVCICIHVCVCRFGIAVHFRIYPVFYGPTLLLFLSPNFDKSGVKTLSFSSSPLSKGVWMYVLPSPPPPVLPTCRGLTHASHLQQAIHQMPNHQIQNTKQTFTKTEEKHVRKH